MKPQTIDEFHAALSPEDRVICDLLRRELDHNLPGADSKLWHAHPVWFLKGNPIAGYSRLKDSVRLLFWSGQSFATPGLHPEGSFKAAEIRVIRPDQIDLALLRSWLIEACSIQWDYKNIIKRKGHLERIC